LADRPRALLAAGYALWDVIGSAERPGSLDADIRAPVLNDVPALLAAYPGIALVAFNGGTAARLARAWTGRVTARTVTLPSSSAAYTLAFEAKLAAWRAALSPERPSASS
jgi:hypoxanthine-DNA glycosylase